MFDVTQQDLRRGVRFCIAIHENDAPVLELVEREVTEAGRWMEHAVACALVCELLLGKVDVLDEGACALWLHDAVDRYLIDPPRPA